jgi:hypothetical protein
MIRKVFSQVIHFAILFSLLFFIALLLTNSFSSGPSPTVAEKWFKYGKVVPPLDYNADFFRPIDIDLYSTKEIEYSYAGHHEVFLFSDNKFLLA